MSKINNAAKGLEVKNEVPSGVSSNAVPASSSMSSINENPNSSLNPATSII